MNILVTGSAGFIGFHLTKRLLEEGYTVHGIDNHNNYYDTSLKESRFNILKKFKRYSHNRFCLTDEVALNKLFKKIKFDAVINLAAQAGVRYSIENPQSYISSNLIGFFNVIENVRNYGIDHLIYASSSSVYGANTKLPFSEIDKTSTQLSLYAATKKSNEVIAHSYSSMYKFKSTGLRFFTVYGPWGRPDMALFKFTNAIKNNQSIEIYNNGNHTRDFTYIDDVVEMIFRIIVNKQNSNLSNIYNIGNGNPKPLMSYIKEIEKQLGCESKKVFLPLQIGDVPETSADMTAYKKEYQYSAETNIEIGVEKFINWYQEYYG